MEGKKQPQLRKANFVFQETACYFFASLPLSVVISPRSSPFILSLTALCLIIGFFFGNTKVSKQLSIKSIFTSPLSLLIIVFLFWCFASTLWSEEPGHTFQKFMEFILVLSLVFVLSLSLPQHLQKRHVQWLCGMIILSSAIILIELTSDLAFRIWFKGETFTYVFNRSVLTLVFLSIPLASNWVSVTALVMSRSKHVRFCVFLGTSAFLCLVLGVAESGAAVLACLVAVISYLLFLFIPRIAFILVCCAVCATFILAPFAGSIADSLLPKKAYKTLETAHVQERVDIWKSFGKVVLKKPVLGSGYDTSRFAGQSDIVQTNELTQEEKNGLQMWHPHNAALQIWYELGGVGALIFMAICASLLWKIRRSMSCFKNGKYAYMAAFISVSATAHGIWQSWWVATIAAGIIWFIALERLQSDHPKNNQT